MSKFSPLQVIWPKKHLSTFKSRIIGCIFCYKENNMPIGNPTRLEERLKVKDR
jgi:hypothetical protein